MHTFEKKKLYVNSDMIPNRNKWKIVLKSKK